MKTPIQTITKSGTYKKTGVQEAESCSFRYRIPACSLVFPSWISHIALITLITLITFTLLNTAISPCSAQIVKSESDTKKPEISRKGRISSEERRNTSTPLTIPEEISFLLLDSRQSIPPMEFNLIGSDGQKLLTGTVTSNGGTGLKFDTLPPVAKILWVQNGLSIQLISKTRNILCASSPGRPLFDVNFPLGPSEKLELNPSDPGLSEGINACHRVDQWFRKIFGSGHELGILPGIFKSAYTLREKALSPFQLPGRSNEHQRSASPTIQAVKNLPPGAPPDEMVQLEKGLNFEKGLCGALLLRLFPDLKPDLSELLIQTMMAETGNLILEKSMQNGASPGHEFLKFLKKSKVSNPTQFLLLRLNEGAPRNYNDFLEALTGKFSDLKKIRPKLESRNENQNTAASALDKTDSESAKADAENPSENRNTVNPPENFGWTVKQDQQHKTSTDTSDNSTSNRDIENTPEKIPTSSSEPSDPSQTAASNRVAQGVAEVELEGILNTKIAEIRKEIDAFRNGFNSLFAALESERISPDDFSGKHDMLWQTMNRTLAIDRTGHMWGEAASWYIRFLSYVPEKSPLHKKTERAMAETVEYLEKSQKEINIIPRKRQIAMKMASTDRNYLNLARTLEECAENWKSRTALMEKNLRNLAAALPGSPIPEKEKLIPAWKNYIHRFESWKKRASEILGRQQMLTSDASSIKDLLEASRLLSTPLPEAYNFLVTLESDSRPIFNNTMAAYHECSKKLSTNLLSLARALSIQELPEKRIMIGSPEKMEEWKAGTAEDKMDEFEAMARELSLSNPKAMENEILAISGKLDSLALFLAQAESSSAFFAEPPADRDGKISNQKSKNFAFSNNQMASAGRDEIQEIKGQKIVPGKDTSHSANDEPHCETGRIFINDCRVLDLSTPIYLDRSFLSEGKVVLTGEINHNLDYLGGVAVSFDNGKTWDLADGRDFWIYSFFPPAEREMKISVKAVTEKGDEIPGTMRTLNLIIR
ncbi:MAG: hypothetical protein CVV64_02310 [Candidatus Wallbacteria bacterium HGW-Wallbacteria-1]|uniref:Uncharacterized protein n=1 Tax=Candidatus Wallbacteria bacterium HGW-Wallbacteria-1 TaxID=2013854 RepID=A0A2N1PV94_9BACT|nr:MAG: hypothetical protein CVV64_02310 [Candidatus Wallbacteria bacterium HGW-Wallbacteria-1]